MTLYGEMNIVRKERDQEGLVFHDGDVPFFSIPSFDRLGIKNGFSTRLGGISTGSQATLNLSFFREPYDVVRENYKRICHVLGMDDNRGVISRQTHTTNIRVVTEQDAGKGIEKPADYENIDGLITNVPNIPLVTLYADCVPLYFYDSTKKVIGLSHSGWKGTVHRMGRETIQKMSETYGCCPKDIFVAIGPSICGDCYEVSKDVANEFCDEFGINDFQMIGKPQGNGKYLLNLWKANELIFLQAGIPSEHIFVTDVCTKCNPNLLFSHRVLGDKRGNLAALISL